MHSLHQLYFSLKVWIPNCGCRLQMWAYQLLVEFQIFGFISILFLDSLRNQSLSISALTVMQSLPCRWKPFGPLCLHRLSDTASHPEPILVTPHIYSANPPNQYIWDTKGQFSMVNRLNIWSMGGNANKGSICKLYTDNHPRWS